ncbi:MAG: O-antigen ligase family protein, partial [Bacteroidota bacterium]
VLVVGFVGIFRERRVLAGLAVAGVLASLLIPGVTERLSQLGNFGSHLTGRDVIWRGAMDLMTERPVTGFGLKTFPVIFPYFNLLEDKGVGTWHNDIIQVYLESGLIGLATFGWLIVAAYRFGIQAIRRHRADEFSKTLSQSLLIIISTFLLGGLVGGFITDPLSSLVFRQCLGFLALLSIVPATRPEAGVP